MRVLVVEDEVKMAGLLKRALEEEGYAVDVAGRGEDALWLGTENPYDAIVLDLMLPDVDGFEVSRRLREAGRWSPVLMLTARDAVADRVAGLDAGADDYLVKPFDLGELAARLRALLRRGAGRAEPVVTYGDIAFNPATRDVRVAGSPVHLSARELALLEALLARPGAILSRTQLEDRLYGWNEPVESNAVEVHIHALRRKLGADLIRNVRGVGWMLAKRDSAAA